MSDIGKVRLRAALDHQARRRRAGALRSIIHPMERIERDKQGKIIEQELQLHQQGGRDLPGQDRRRPSTRRRASARIRSSRSPFRATDPGPLKVAFHDTPGGKYEGTAEIKFCADARDAGRVRWLGLIAAGGRLLPLGAPTRPTTPAFRAGPRAPSRGPRRDPDRSRTAARGGALPGLADHGLREVPHLRLRRHGGPSRPCRSARPCRPAWWAIRRRAARCSWLAPKGPCTGCHLIPGDDVWPAGSVGPDLSTIGDRKLTDAYLYQQLWDPRVVFPQHVDAAVGRAGRLHAGGARASRRLSADAAAVRCAAEKDHRSQPVHAAPKPVGFGDNLDPTNNPAVLLRRGRRGAVAGAKGPTGKACADCHARQRRAVDARRGDAISEVRARVRARDEPSRTS